MEEILARVQSAFQKAFEIDPNSISINTSPTDVPAWDSLGHVNLASSLEQVFGLTFDVDDLMAMENVKEICHIVHRQLSKAQSASIQ
jgi:acyl carrier protein